MEKNIYDKRNDVDNKVAELNKSILLTSQSFSSMEDKISKMNKKINHIYDSAQKQINAAGNKLDYSVSSIQNTKTKIDLINPDLIAQRLDNINKLQNSFYNMFIHMHISDTNKENISKAKHDLLDDLNKKGFVIYDQNIEELSVDSNEVIYYHKSAEDHAKLISSALEPCINKKIPMKCYLNTGQSPQNILIKLRFD